MAAERLIGSFQDLIVKITAACPGPRHLVAIAGAPGSGKSTVAEDLARQLDSAMVLPMDGFHLDDSVLDDRGLLSRKGAPETFDLGGLIALQRRLQANSEDEIIAPSFDRSIEVSRAGAISIPKETKLVLVEGNYLLFQQGRWPELAQAYSLTVMIDVPHDLLRQRLMNRWLGFGFNAEAAAAKVDGNDLPNAQLVVENSQPADVTYRNLGSSEGT